jgi:hypothetical protein
MNRHQQEVAQGQPADLADLGGLPDGPDTQHDRAEDDRGDQHPDQRHEGVAQPLEPDGEVGEHQADHDAEGDRGDDGEVEPVASTVRRHGGSVSVRPGPGAEFRVPVPALRS